MALHPVQYISSNEAPEHDFVTVRIPAAERRDAAVKLLDAAGEEHQLVRTLTVGFRAPRAIATAAGLGEFLDEVEDEETAIAETPAVPPATGKRGGKAAAAAAEGAGQ